MNAPRRVTTVPGRTGPSASSFPASHLLPGTSRVASTPACSSVQYSPRPLAPGNRQLIPTMAMGSGELSTAIGSPAGRGETSRGAPVPPAADGAAGGCAAGGTGGGARVRGGTAAGGTAGGSALPWAAAALIT